MTILDYLANCCCKEIWAYRHNFSFCHYVNLGGDLKEDILTPYDVNYTFIIADLFSRGCFLCIKLLSLYSYIYLRSDISFSNFLFFNFYKLNNS